MGWWLVPKDFVSNPTKKLDVWGKDAQKSSEIVPTSFCIKITDYCFLINIKQATIYSTYVLGDMRGIHGQGYPGS